MLSSKTYIDSMAKQHFLDVAGAFQIGKVEIGNQCHVEIGVSCHTKCARQTFTNVFWNEQGCYAAMLHHSIFSTGSSVAAAINSCLRQFSGLETDADDVEVRVV